MNERDSGNGSSFASLWIVIGILLIILGIDDAEADNATADFFNTMQFKVLTCDSFDQVQCGKVYTSLRGEDGTHYKCPVKPAGHVFDYENECTKIISSKKGKVSYKCPPKPDGYEYDYEKECKKEITLNVGD